MKKRRRFRRRGPRRPAATGKQLSKTVRGLEGDGLDTWSETLAPREAISAGEKDAPDAEADDVLDPKALENAFLGRVVSLASGLAWIEREPGGEASTEPPPEHEEPIRCVLPSSIARGQQELIAVGDLVQAAPHGEGHRVLQVTSRRTDLSRPDPLQPRARRVVAANVDLVVHLASLVSPPLRPNLVDRYLIAVQQGGADALLVVNKVDLVPDAERKKALAPLEGYRGMLPVIEASAKTGEGIDSLRRALAGKISVVVGHSGVGKSSIVNALDPKIDAATGEISRALGVGRHTTTSSNLYRLAGNIRLIDTPGIREFGLWDLDARSLSAYFPDFDEFTHACKFRNCTHSHEPRCAVRDAVASGDLPGARHATYLRILASLDDD
ncbi:MAG: ribosome small subunit-dependent GTPase A [Acidobacteriota bacterium]